MVLYPSSSKKPGGIFLLYLLWESGYIPDRNSAVLTLTEFAWCFLTFRLSTLELQQFVKQCRFPIPELLLSALVSQALYLLVSLHLGADVYPSAPLSCGSRKSWIFSLFSFYLFGNGRVTSTLLICETGHLVYVKTQSYFKMWYWYDILPVINMNK